MYLYDLIVFVIYNFRAPLGFTIYQMANDISEREDLHEQ